MVLLSWLAASGLLSKKRDRAAKAARYSASLRIGFNGGMVAFSCCHKGEVFLM